MGKINFITEESFNQIKEMLYRGETTGEINRQTGRAYQTIKIIEQATDWENYPIAQKEYYARTKHKELPAKPIETILPVKSRRNISDQITNIIIQELEQYHRGYIAILKGEQKEQ